MRNKQLFTWNKHSSLPLWQTWLKIISHSFTSKPDTVYLHMWSGKSDSVLSKVLWCLCREFHQRKVLGVTAEAFEKRTILGKKLPLLFSSLFPGHPYLWAVLITDPSYPPFNHTAEEQGERKSSHRATAASTHCPSSKLCLQSIYRTLPSEISACLPTFLWRTVPFWQRRINPFWTSVIKSWNGLGWKGP